MFAWMLQPSRTMPGLSNFTSRMSPLLYMPRSKRCGCESENTL